MTEIRSVQFTRASEADRTAGLLYWIEFDYGDLHIDGASLRRTLAGDVRLSLPTRRSRTDGRAYPTVRLLSGEARRRVEQQVLAALCEAERDRGAARRGR